MNYQFTKLFSLSLFSSVLLFNAVDSNIARASELEPTNNSEQLVLLENLSRQDSNFQTRKIAQAHEQSIVETEIPVVTLEETEIINDNNYFSNTENRSNILTLFAIEF